MEDRVTETQVLIIGGGIVGTAIARELSKYKVDVCLVEKEGDVGSGITKGSLGLLHSGLGICTSRLVKWWDRSVDVNLYLRQPLRTKEKLNIVGRQMLIELQPFLNTKIVKCGRIILAQNQDDMKVLEIMKEVTEGIGIKDLVFLEKNKLQEMEPALDYSKFIEGLYDPGEYSVFPAEWPIAFAENAKQNGAHIVLNTEVKGIEERKGYYVIKTNNGSIKAEFVINAAGLFSDEIAAMIGKVDWSFVMWKSHLMIIENKGYLNHIVSEVIVPQTPRILVPTTEGNLEVGVTMEKGTDKYDYSTTKEMLDFLTDYPQFYIPSISPKKDMIRSFVAYMHFNTRDPDDYIIEWPRERFLNLIVCAPGIGPAPALAQEVVKMLASRGLELIERSDFDPYRHRVWRFIELPADEKNRKIREDPRYGHVICRCKTVTEGEIVDAIHGGASTLDGVKFRTGAGMGPCQGNFCGPKIASLLAQQLQQPLEEVTKKGQGSNYICQST